MTCSQSLGRYHSQIPIDFAEVKASMTGATKGISSLSPTDNLADIFWSKEGKPAIWKPLNWREKPQTSIIKISISALNQPLKATSGPNLKRHKCVLGLCLHR